MPEATDANAGYDDLLDAVAADEGYYIECGAGHGALPPRRACPHCGRTDLEATPLPGDGAVESYTVVHVPTPQLEGDVPYTTAIARFGPVRVSGFLRGLDDGADPMGTPVRLTTEETAAGDRALVLRPA